MSENKPIGFLGDNLGDKSSKRLTSLILLLCSIGVALFALIFDAVVGWKSYELIKYIITAFLGGSLLAQGLTLPEFFSKKQ